MVMKREVENWLNLARYDLGVARDMLEAGRYPYTVFFCHLAVEKALKAKVQEVTGKTPPKIHELVALLKLSGLTPPAKLVDFIGKLGGASTAMRYPVDLSELIKAYTSEVAQEYLQQTNEVVEWIARQLKC